MRHKKLGSKGWLAVAFTVAVLLTNAAYAAKEHPGRCPRCCRGEAKCCCVDDYCPKPMPCVPCLPRCGSCNDYCPKPMPCVPRARMGCCDDYCPKPMPCVGCYRR